MSECSPRQDEDAARIAGPAAGGVGLLVVDMINAMDFEGAEPIRPKAVAVAEAILDLRGQADQAGVPTIYVNDNFGQWHWDRSRIVEACLSPQSPGRDMVRRIAPRDDDYFIVKPQISGFYATNLPVLLPKLGVTRVIVTGIAADICVLFTAADAHMRAYELWTPRDAVASEQDERTEWALEIMRKSMGAHIVPTHLMTLDQWVRPVSN
jgi:nicotinamidase-related amidase